MGMDLYVLYSMIYTKIFFVSSYSFVKYIVF